MASFRYAQSCALARATELLGERWTLLVLRELTIEPRRFAELRRALRGVTGSVLSERLDSLVEAGLVAHEPGVNRHGGRYRLTPAGDALKPAMLELVRWGARFLLPLRDGDSLEPGWLALALEACARRRPGPGRTFDVTIRGAPPVRLLVVAGPDGTRVTRATGSAGVAFEADPACALGLMAGLVDPGTEVQSGTLRISRGDIEAVRAFRDLFEVAAGTDA
ncbi:MAG: transcriptional regulator [Dehalococcoidia bacterium]|nr:transcriptional regulator [Dehalococcoidia bacterium]